MYKFTVSPELLLMLVAGGLSLVFSYLPIVRQWFESLSPESKRLLNVGLVILFAVVIFAGDCFALFITNLECTVKGSFDLVYMIFLAITINQGMHKGLKPSPALKARLFTK
jgi:hypothetical protein